MKIYSEKTKKFYDSTEACLAAEDKYDAKERETKAKLGKEAEAQKALAKARADKAKEVEQAFTHANDLLKDFIKEYGSFHYTFSDTSPLFLNPFWPFL